MGRLDVAHVLAVGSRANLGVAHLIDDAAATFDNLDGGKRDGLPARTGIAGIDEFLAEVILGFQFFLLEQVETALLGSAGPSHFQTAGREIEVAGSRDAEVDFVVGQVGGIAHRAVTVDEVLHSVEAGQVLRRGDDVVDGLGIGVVTRRIVLAHEVVELRHVEWPRVDMRVDAIARSGAEEERLAPLPILTARLPEFGHLVQVGLRAACVECFDGTNQFLGGIGQALVGRNNGLVDELFVGSSESRFLGFVGVLVVIIVVTGREDGHCGHSGQHHCILEKLFHVSFSNL